MESSLLTHAAVENICVCGDSSRSNVVCLVIPSQQFLDSLAAKVCCLYSKLLVWSSTVFTFQLKKSELTREELCLDEGIVTEYAKIINSHGLQQG